MQVHGLAIVHAHGELGSSAVFAVQRDILVFFVADVRVGGRRGAVCRHRGGSRWHILRSMVGGMPVAALGASPHPYLPIANNFTGGIAHHHLAQWRLRSHAPGPPHQQCQHRDRQHHRQPDAHIQFLKKEAHVQPLRRGSAAFIPAGGRTRNPPRAPSECAWGLLGRSR